MKDKILSVMFILFLNIIFLLNIFIHDKEISTSERRKLEQFPIPNKTNILNKQFMKDFDNYATDQFVFRNSFRSIKANINYNLFLKKDNNKIYTHKSHIFKSEYPTNKKSINNFINKINSIEKHLNKNNIVYYAIIPDKNYFVNKNKYLNIDYEYLYEEIQKINYEYIELRDLLLLDDYYKTDTHWKQEKLCKIVNRLGQYFGFYNECKYDKKSYDNFYGVYYGQSALNKKPDKLTYLINQKILNSEVYYLENNNYNGIYFEEYLKNLDSYDIFLSGASSYIEIINKESQNNKELVIFRDSFGSSLAPLLVDFYSKITLIDIRYIDSKEYLKYIKFDNQDVLFIYSTLLVNNSITLKN